MARREVINAILQSFKKLGGNTNDVLGTKTNVNFLGKGKSPELMLDMDINADALGVLPRSQAVEELKNSVGYAVSGKLNDIQANQLLKNMQTMDSVYFPPPGPVNIIDLETRAGPLSKGGLESLRKVMADDLPPPGSRGGPDDIAAPIQSAEKTITNLAKAPTGSGLELLKNVKNNNLIVNDLVDKIYLNAGVAPAAQPVVRANAREFLNRIKNLSDEPGNTTLSDVMEVDDFKFMTEGGGGGMGDPLLLVQKYFGPKVASAVAKLDGPNDIQLFAERLVSVTDDAGRTITDRRFNPETVDLDDFEFADGGRVPFFGGGAARLGKASFEALRKYGFTGSDVSRLFGKMSADKTMVGPEKTEYFKQLYKVLKNPDDFPDAIKDLQKQLGIDVGIGFRNGGLAGILEV